MSVASVSSVAGPGCSDAGVGGTLQIGMYGRKGDLLLIVALF